MFRPKKLFGQNFLTDRNIAAKIVESASIESGDDVWEIGPGKGMLTSELLKVTRSLTCFEIDRELVSVLEEKFGSKINLLSGDVLKADWSKLIRDHEQQRCQQPKIVLVANIPYNITSPLLYKITEFASSFRLIIIMIQKEVADRICATPGSKSYGVMSLKIQYNFDVKKLFKVPPHLFRPQPKVDSAVVRLVPEIEKDQLDDPQLFWQIVETAFHSRRKTLKNNLSNLLSKEELQILTDMLSDGELFQALPSAAKNKKKPQISLVSRGETLDEEDFIRLYHLIRHIRAGNL